MCQTTDGDLDTDGNLKTPAQAGIIPGAESLRDGATRNRPDTIQSYTNNGNIKNNLDKGHHESERFYYACQQRQRNKGLFIADQGVGNNAINTRQNPGGGRSGLECAEERDYYPYWSPSPWKDVVLMTDHTEQFCNKTTTPWTYNGPSQNVASVGLCKPLDGADDTSVQTALAKNNEAACASVGKWTLYSHNMPAPLCQQAEWSRVNHLGNGRFGQPLSYNWTLPSIADLKAQGVYTYGTAATGEYAKCVLRMRYNISTDDYDRTHTRSTQRRTARDGRMRPWKLAAPPAHGVVFFFFLVAFPSCFQHTARIIPSVRTRLTASFPR